MRSGWTLRREYCTIAATDNPVGVQCVNAVMQVLMNWAQKDYRPWFEKIVTD